jgi:hypothetical protein
MVGFVLLVFAFTFLGLMEVDGAQSRIEKLESEYPHLQLSQAFKLITRQFQKYIFIRSLASIMTGLVTFLFAAVVGLELAFAWGVITFVLNLIPFLGPVAAVVLTTLFAAAQFETLQMPLVVLAGLSVIHFWIGSYIEPLLAGATLAISPFLVLLAVFFWSFPFRSRRWQRRRAGRGCVHACYSSITSSARSRIDRSLRLRCRSRVVQGKCRSHIVMIWRRHLDVKLIGRHLFQSGDSLRSSAMQSMKRLAVPIAELASAAPAAA